MQRRRHRPHHVVADEHRQHENGKPEHEGMDRVGGVVHGGSLLSSPLPVGERVASSEAASRVRGNRPIDRPLPPPPPPPGEPPPPRGGGGGAGGGPRKF